MSPTPEFEAVAVAGGDLAVARWGSGPSVILGIHGITASSMSLAPVARHLDERFTLVAPDLRGRGASSNLPPPYGMRAHAEDCAGVILAMAPGPVTVVGESMGAFVAVVLASMRPDLVERVVLVDGGLPLPAPAGIDPDLVLEAILGPSLARLRDTYRSRDAYVDFWRAHPAVGEAWNDDVEAYVQYDLIGVAPRLRSRVAEAAVRADGADTLANPEVVTSALRTLTCPVHLLRATRNLLNEPPGLISDALVETWRVDLPQLTDEVIDDTNHYSLMFAERGATAIARSAVPPRLDRVVPAPSG